MRLLHRLIDFISRIFRTARMLRKYWREGDIVKVNIAQINYGGILKGKSVLITGGSSGIGLAIARKCLSEGAMVVITGRNEEKLIKASDQLNSPLLKTLVWDVSVISQLEEKLQEANLLVGGEMDILINNAGILTNESFYTTTESGWDKVYNTNSKGLFFLTQSMSNSWIKNKVKGKIINISSTGGFLGASYPYRMTKWDLVGLTNGLGSILSPHGIIVNGIAPGRTATDMLGINAKENVYDKHQPLKRFGLPEEIAELAVFLMSDAANYIVGQTIICDGGYTLKV